MAIGPDDLLPALVQVRPKAPFYVTTIPSNVVVPEQASLSAGYIGDDIDSSKTKQ
jgi:hypothetical protein